MSDREGNPPETSMVRLQGALLVHRGQGRKVSMHMEMSPPIHLEPSGSREETPFPKA